MKLIIGNKYKWKHENRVLCYIGEKAGWHQFTFNGRVYCEVLGLDLQLMEPVE